MGTLRATAILVVFFVVTATLIPLQWVVVKLGLSARRSIPKAYHRFVCGLFGVRVRVVGTPVKGGVLMASNHLGWLDIPILSSVAPVSFVAKQEVGAWAFFGTLARLQRTIFIRRERAKAAEDRDTIRRRLLDGEALVIFPEGTSTDGNRVLPFKSSLLSAAELALDAAGTTHIPVQPVSVAYVGLHGMPMGRENRPLFAWYGDMELVPHLWEALETGPIEVVVDFHAPLSIGEFRDRKSLASAVEASVRAGVVSALAGAQVVPAPPHHDEELVEALDDAESETGEAAE